MHLLLRTLIVAAGVAFASRSAVAVIVWDEAINGDLSENRASPTSLTITSGTNTVIATSVNGDREYFTFTLPTGFQLTSIMLTSYVGADVTAFIGVQAGPAMTVSPTSGSPAGLLGYTHFGTGPGNVGADILGSMGLGAGATGFSGPLPAGSYTFWTQQTGFSSSTYRLDFLAVPEPETAGLMLVGIAVLAAGLHRTARRKQKPTRSPDAKA